MISSGEALRELPVAEGVEPIRDDLPPFDSLLNLQKTFPDFFHAIAANRNPGYITCGKAAADSELRPGITVNHVHNVYQALQNSPDRDPGRYNKLWHDHFIVPDYVSENSRTMSGAPELSLDEYASNLLLDLIYHEPVRTGTTMIGTHNPSTKAAPRYPETYPHDTEAIVAGYLADARASDPLRRETLERHVIGMANNTASMIASYGYVPNGLRWYYDRPQIPILASLVKQVVSHFNATGRSEYVPRIREEYLPWIVKEYESWMEGEDRLKPNPEESVIGHVVLLPDGESVLNRAFGKAAPRPESYQEDLETISRVKDRDPAQVMGSLVSMCIYGKDFTARMYDNPSQRETAVAQDLITPELNSRLAEIEKTIAEYYHRSGRSELAAEYDQRFQRRQEAIDKYLWNPRGFYADYNYKTGRQLSHIHMGTAYPIARGAAFWYRRQRVAQTLYKHLLGPNGFRSSLLKSDEQWDGNVWAPDQWEGEKALVTAKRFAWAVDAVHRYNQANSVVYSQTGTLVEKLDGEELRPGGGGEYVGQGGMGMTAGVYLVNREVLAGFDHLKAA